jgi:hypothetical protein
MSFPGGLVVEAGGACKSQMEHAAMHIVIIFLPEPGG